MLYYNILLLEAFIFDFKKDVVKINDKLELN